MTNKTWQLLVLKVVFLAGIFIFTIKAGAEEFPDCECPKVNCHRVCEKQIDISFYSEKCGEKGGQVRSCAKPTCETVAPTPEKCLEMGFKPKKVNSRGIASEDVQLKKDSENHEYKKRDKKIVAKIGLVEGSAWVHRIGTKKQKAYVGMDLKEKDVVATSKKSKIRIEFEDGNILNLSPDSRLKITTVINEPNKRQSILNLIKGKVRSKVKQKYQGAQNYYQVRTRSAVAGVRGTDFIVSFSVDDKDITKVSTLTGEVELKSPDGEQKLNIGKGQFASFVATNNGAKVFDDDDISEFVNRGYMTPVYKMSAAELKALDWETELLAYNKRKARETASMSKFICNAPEGKLNQCSWQCKNNPAGEKKCRTDLTNVHCVRRRCNANGDWSNETRLPASFSDLCEPEVVKVKDCDY